MICVSPSELKIIMDIFKKHIPKGEVRAFGSRYKWQCKDYSDLDIAINISRPMTSEELGAIEEDFIESDLPYRVDILDYNGISKEFRAVIDKGCEVIYKANGWKKVRLGNICKTNSNTYSVSEKVNFINYLDTGNITENNISNIQHIVISSDKLPSRARRKVTTNDIIYSTVRPNQRHYGIIKKVLPNMLVSTGFTVISVDESIADSYFIYYYLTQNNIVEGLQTLAEQSVSTYPSIKASDIENLEIVLPPLSEQRFIANILSSLDDKIETNNRINKTLEEMAQAIFKSWFVDFEPFLEGEFEDSELGRIPRGWRVGTLSDIATITMGQSPKGDTYNESGNGKVFYQGRAEFGARFPKRRLFTTAPNRMASENDVLLSVRAPVGDYNIATESCCIGRGLASIKPLNQTYSYCICLMTELQPTFRQFNAEGTVFGSINKDSLNGIGVIIPDDNTLMKFENLVSTLNHQIRFNYSNTQTLAAIRDSLLPKLMSGEIIPEHSPRL